MPTSRSNGFRIRGLNADCDRLAVQSSEQSTWLLGRKRGGMGKIQWHEVALLQNELMVLRAYGGSPEFEIEPLGDASGLLVLQLSRGTTFALRVKSKRVVQLGQDESCVVRCELIQYPTSPGVQPGGYGHGLQV